MASDSSSVDRPGLVVSLVLCPFCDGKYPTEEHPQTTCIYCKKTFQVFDNLWDDKKDALLTDKPRLCKALCKGRRECWLRTGCVNSNRYDKTEQEEPPQYWWQRY